MTEEEKRELILDARQYAFAAPIILPLIEGRKRVALEKLIMNYRGGKELLSCAAEISALTDLEFEVKQKENIFNQLKETTDGN